MSAAVKVPGVEMQFDGQAYVVPPLNAAAVKQYRASVGDFLSGGTMPDIHIVCKLLHAAMTRNYPDLTLEQVEQWVDYGNMTDVMDTVMCIAGMVASMGNLARRIQSAMDPARTAPPTPSKN